MARRRPSLGLFGIFGRSEDLRYLDRALREFDLHPALIPDAVKLTVLNLLKDARGEEPRPEDYRQTAALLGFSALGGEAFAAANGESAALSAEIRVETALDAGDSLDAKLILLALHAGIIHPDLKQTYELQIE